MSFIDFEPVAPFDFYDQGRVQPAEARSRNPESKDFSVGRKLIAVDLFEIDGMSRAVMILAYDQDLDASIYSEIANILASRLAGQVFDRESFVTPPKEIPVQSYERLKKMGFPFNHFEYHHIHQNHLNKLDSLVFYFRNKETPDA
jgi:hypothetical protein